MSCGKVLLKVDIVRVEYDSKIPSLKTIRAPYNHDMRLCSSMIVPFLLW